MIIRVLGVPYRVLKAPLGDYGHVIAKRQLIVIDESLGPEEFAESLTHEVLHIIAHAMNTDVPEEIIWRLSRGFYSVITDADNVDYLATLMGGEWEWENEDDVDDCVELSPEVVVHPGCPADGRRSIWTEYLYEGEDQREGIGVPKPSDKNGLTGLCKQVVEKFNRNSESSDRGMEGYCGGECGSTSGSSE